MHFLGHYSFYMRRSPVMKRIPVNNSELMFPQLFTCFECSTKSTPLSDFFATNSINTVASFRGLEKKHIVPFRGSFIERLPGLTEFVKICSYFERSERLCTLKLCFRSSLLLFFFYRAFPLLFRHALDCKVSSRK